MILLDTNIISELMRLKPNSAVIEWLDEQFSHELFLPAIVKAEIEMGIAILDDGKRKRALLQAAELIFMSFTNRCLPFDGETATHYAKIIAFTKKQGRPMSVEDAQIAAIAIQNSALLATRNTTDFDFLEKLNLVNPWQYTTN
ncbi:MAG: VapC toxin family PIN domain ribonuclease [Bacteroidetes bacterium]|nr:MAG: VapC toxin family PIN domain ribonuclease [Bacteroidota bacterium]